jgi:hypothetical protein
MAFLIYSVNIFLYNISKPILGAIAHNVPVVSDVFLRPIKETA